MSKISNLEIGIYILYVIVQNLIGGLVPKGVRCPKPLAAKGPESLGSRHQAKTLAFVCEALQNPGNTETLIKNPIKQKRREIKKGQENMPYRVCSS